MAERALNETNGIIFNSKALNVNYAMAPRKPFEFTRCSPSSYSSRSRRSRSRSPPKRTRNDEIKLRERIDDLTKKNQDLFAKNVRYLKDVEDQRVIIADLRKEIYSLKAQLEASKSEFLMFLPCGHSKEVKPRDRVLLDELLKEGVESLTPEERRNENILRRLRNKIFYMMERKIPDSYRCITKETFIRGECGHALTAECWEIRSYKRGDRSLYCSQVVEKILVCGHKEQVLCSKPVDTITCSRCRSSMTTF